MKKSGSVICIVFSMLLMLTSCNKDQASSLVGKWEWIETEIITYLDGEVYYSHTSTPSGEVFMEFNSNGTFSYIIVEGSESKSIGGSYLALDNEVTITFKDGSDVEVHTYTIESISHSSLILVNEEDYMRSGKVYQEVTRITLNKV